MRVSLVLPSLTLARTISHRPFCQASAISFMLWACFTSSDYFLFKTKVYKTDSEYCLAIKKTFSQWMGKSRALSTFSMGWKTLRKSIKKLYRLRHIFWPDRKWQFCQTVHMIFKKNISWRQGFLGVVNLHFEWFLKYTSSSFTIASSLIRMIVIYRKKYHTYDSQWMSMG